MKPRQEQQKIIKSVLKKIYFQYKTRGIISIYLWGSVLTDDFDSKSSDIDSIAIVNNRATMEDQLFINQGYLKKYRSFKLNYLYLSELNGGRIKGRLARIIHPSLLLLDFKNWRVVAGKKYHRRDFKLKEIDFNEATKLSINTIKKRYLPLFRKGDFESSQYFIKSLMKICHYLNQKDLGRHEFKYNELLDKSPAGRKEIVKLLLKIREKNWNRSLVKKNLNILIEFIKKLA